MTAQSPQKRRMTAREGSVRTGVSARHVRRLVALPRAEYIAEKAAEREAIRAFHDDEGHSWPQTAEHFGLHLNTVKQRAYRARKERAAERETVKQIESETPLSEAS